MNLNQRIRACSLAISVMQVQVAVVEPVGGGQQAVWPNTRNVRRNERQQQLHRLHFVVLRNVLPRSEGNNAFVYKVISVNVQHMRQLVLPRVGAAKKLKKRQSSTRNSGSQLPVEHYIVSDALDVVRPVLQLLEVGFHPGNNILNSP
jgi:hypothetical protein